MLTDIGIRVTLNVPYEQAVRKTTDALTAAGFGVLTQIDMKVRLKQKVDTDFRRHVIVGTCPPPALLAAPTQRDVRLLLPCNVTVYEEGDESVVVAVDPVKMLGAIKEDPVAHEVAVGAKTRLQRAITSLK